MKTAHELGVAGNTLFEQGDMTGARLHYQAALEADPFYLPALANLGQILSSERQNEAAASCLSLVTTIAPNDGKQWSNYGNVLMHLHRYDEAEAAMTNAAELSPDSPEVWHNLALLTSRMHRYDEALGYVKRARELGHDSNGLRNDESLTLLHKGDLDLALVAYEARWEIMPHSPAWDFHIPEWQGQDLNGKHILFHAEQGFGDTIMMSRFIHDLKALGARVTFGVSSPMIRLFEAQNWDIEILDLFQMTQEDVEGFDYHSPEFSALRWLKIDRNEIRGTPYLRVPDILGPPILSKTFNVGICWASGKRGTQADWRRRVVPLVDFLQLMEVPGVQLHSLQGGADSTAISEIGVEALVCDPTEGFLDWADTAAFVNKLDLVVSIDTAVAHLAAALGKPTWMIEQHFNCWRWWDLARGTGKPWYDRMRVLHQADPNSWRAELAQCKDWLCSEVQAKFALRAA